MKHIYIYDKDSKMPAVEVKDGNALYQIQQLEGADFDKQYYTVVTEVANPEDEYFGVYPKNWDPFVL